MNNDLLITILGTIVDISDAFIFMGFLLMSFVGVGHFKLNKLAYAGMWTMFLGIIGQALLTLGVVPYGYYIWGLKDAGIAMTLWGFIIIILDEMKEKGTRIDED